MLQHQNVEVCCIKVSRRVNQRSLWRAQVATGDGWAEYVARPTIMPGEHAAAAAAGAALAAVNASLDAAAGDAHGGGADGGGGAPEMDRGAALFFVLFYLATWVHIIYIHTHTYIYYLR